MNTAVNESLVAELAGNPELQAEVDAYEAEQQQETAPEPVDEPEKAPEKAEKPSSDAVPLPVFLDIKSELKESKAALRELQAQMEAMKNPPPVIPEDHRPAFQPTVNYNDDPAEFLRQKIDYQEQLIGWQERQMSATQSMTSQQRQAMEQQQQMAQFAQIVTRAEEQFRNEKADYDDAVTYVRNAELADARAFVEGLGQEWTQAHEEQATKAVIQKFAGIAQTALRSGKNPAQVLYQIASAKGFAKARSAEPDRIERGLQAAKGVSTLAGGRAAQEPQGGGDWLTSLKRGAGYQ